MTTSTYSRLIKTKATSIGQKGRTFWTRILRNRAAHLFPRMDLLATEEALIAKVRKHPGQAQAAWMSIRIRIEHAALLDVLRERHLKNTGHEISRSETQAALMEAGLETIINRDEFKAAP